MATKVAQITGITTTTTGFVKIPSIGIYAFTSNYTPSVPFYIGEWVCGNFLPSGLSFVLAIRGQLDTAWSLTAINAQNALNSAQIINTLKAANCCAVTKAKDYLNEEDGGTECKENFRDIKTMLDLTDSLCGCGGIVPEGETISGRQAVYAFTIEMLQNNTHDVTVTIDTVTYSFTTTSTNVLATVASEIAAYINSLYPQNYPYQAESFDENILIWGSDFDDDNGKAISATITAGSFASFYTPAELSFGTPQILQGVNAITNTQISSILNKICSICNN